MSKSHLYTASDKNKPPITPRWVKVFGAICLMLALLFGILHTTGNSFGGPESHMPSLNHNMHQP
jgi:hypothetical protein